ncbi:hypothetical protein P3T36_006272 [Kitasatospora sp. MAP12-15]|uniref:hypothetical protein n=1 Tax=unclassified Kitasatospora TaxID=2633591 RepID=UPI00247478A1|nr:hypothetical protein [Kitasatospora sp. MAP12-44]MDH6108935.1 hypothetical protein [Kitasatospora sp. MAP12-44]
MGSGTISMTDQGLKDFSATLKEFRSELAKQIQLLSSDVLLAGNTSSVITEVTGLINTYKVFCDDLGTALGTVDSTLGKIYMDLQMASQKLNNADDELTAAQMMTVLQDVLGGVTPPAPAPPA